MDCKYILQNEIHEKYLLGKLEESEKDEYKKHLQECESCRKESEKQRLLINGIREIGRREMRDEISRQVEKERSGKTTVNWGMLLKIAAVLLFFVIAPGIIYYYQNIAPQPKAVSSEMEELIAPNENKTDLTKEGKSKLPESEILQPETALPEEKKIANKSASPASRQVTAQKSIPKARADTDELGAVAGAGSVKKPEDFGNYPETVSSKIQSVQPLKSAPAKSHKKGRGIAGRQEGITVSAAKGKELQGKRTDYVFSSGIYRFDKTESFSRRREGEKLLSAIEKKQQTAPSDYLFRFEEKTVLVHLMEAVSSSKRDKKSSLPLSFAVKTVARDSFVLEMNWFVKSDFRKYNPVRMWIQIFNDRTMQVHIQEEGIYKINLQKDSTQAVLQK